VYLTYPRGGKSGRKFPLTFCVLNEETPAVQAFPSIAGADLEPQAATAYRFVEVRELP
jgi:hypothetical protein